MEGTLRPVQSSNQNNRCTLLLNSAEFWTLVPPGETWSNPNFSIGIILVSSIILFKHIQIGNPVVEIQRKVFAYFCADTLYIQIIPRNFAKISTAVRQQTEDYGKLRRMWIKSISKILKDTALRTNIFG